MSVIQSTQPELRYSKRQNLEHEARIVGDYYRDVIRSYGIDCVYHKLDTSAFKEFPKDVDRNNLLLHAYGYDVDPDYSMSAHMLAYMEVESDIFQLNKYGLNPNMDVSFYFESGDFACALATKLGRYKEYPIDEREVHCEVPDITDEFVEVVDPRTGKTVKDYLSSHVFPYCLGDGYIENFTCGCLSGKMNVEISGYEFGRETTVVCNPYEHTDFKVQYSSNPDLCKSLKRTIENDDYVETMLMLTFRVDKVPVGNGKYKCILNGKIHGNVLFYDVDQLGKYAEMIHPSIGDVIEIDFPDERCREKYEITECYDKQLTQDGISPLLHKYIWKCKARRHVPCSDGSVDETAYDARLQEKRSFEEAATEHIAASVSMYSDGQDAVYGGYELDAASLPTADATDVRNAQHTEHNFIQPSQLLDIMQFECGSKLCTDGYSLVFVAADGNICEVAGTPGQHINGAPHESSVKWLKATPSQVVFTGVDGVASVVVSDEDPTRKVELDMQHTLELDEEERSSQDGGSFFTFGACRTVLFADTSSLYAKLERSGQVVKIA